MKRTIPERESITAEFKSDVKRLSDSELVLAAVCLANTDGGEIYLGVEKDGRITGLHAEHMNLTGLAALIGNRTSPPLSVRVSAIDEGGKTIAKIEVPKSGRLVATTDGTLRRRRLKPDGTPECVPFLPYEFDSRRSDLGLIDYSALAVAGAAEGDLDPLERERLRQTVERHGGDNALLGLTDVELDQALGLVRREGAGRIPTVAGLLLIGRETAIRKHLPTHEVAIQVLEGEGVRVNEFYRSPLLRTFERIQEQIFSRVTEQEIQVGLFRVPIPTVERRAFREALINALTHRDYTKLGAAHVRWQGEYLTVSNPGGFVEGVTLDNILVVEPKPRNPLMADAFKRIGLAERTGRGVDLIFRGLLRYGRPSPDYSGTDATTVVVRMSSGDADLPFLQMILEYEERLKHPLPIESLIIMSMLRIERRVDAGEAAAAIQKDPTAAREALERLVEAGLVTAHGVKKGRTYTMSAKAYRQLGRKADYVRLAGFDLLQQEELVLRYVNEHGEIRRRDVAELCMINSDQAKRLLERLVRSGRLKRTGLKRRAIYGRAQ